MKIFTLVAALMVIFSNVAAHADNDGDPSYSYTLYNCTVSGGAPNAPSVSISKDDTGMQYIDIASFKNDEYIALDLPVSDPMGYAATGVQVTEQPANLESASNPTTVHLSELNLNYTCVHTTAANRNLIKY